MGLRILADEDVPGEAVTALREQGHDVAWMVTAAPGSGDPEVLLRAQAEARVLMTFDKDFGELAFRYGLPASSGVILFRVKTQSSARATALVIGAMQARSDWAGHFSVVEEDRIRMRPLPRTGRTSP